jgi:ADP-heptose:LPS heptosyltransferase
VNPQQKILIIRRDNIGDLVCTTPLIHALRQRFPDGWIGALVNSYNAPVLDGNTDLDEVFVYTKGKHRSAGESLISTYWRRLKMMRRLRQMQIDDVVVATPTPQPRVVQLARWLKPKRIIGFGKVRGLDVSLPIDDQERHEAEDVFRVAALYDISGPPPACRIGGQKECLTAAGGGGEKPLTIGVHISARKPSQRWPAERFAETMARLSETHAVRFLLLWSPGDESNPLHPGDDQKANDVLARVGTGRTASLSIEPRPTHTLKALIDTLAECDAVICADGGAMHVAAGLGLPIVCLFGQSGASRWRPWGVPYQLLQKSSFNVDDISVGDVVTAFNALRVDIREPSA